MALCTALSQHAGELKAGAEAATACGRGWEAAAEGSLSALRKLPPPRTSARSDRIVALAVQLTQGDEGRAAAAALESFAAAVVVDAVEHVVRIEPAMRSRGLRKLGAPTYSAVVELLYAAGAEGREGEGCGTEGGWETRRGESGSESLGYLDWDSSHGSGGVLGVGLRLLEQREDSCGGGRGWRRWHTCARRIFPPAVQLTRIQSGTAAQREGQVGAAAQREGQVGTAAQKGGQVGAAAQRGGGGRTQMRGGDGRWGSGARQEAHLGGSPLEGAPLEGSPLERAPLEGSPLEGAPLERKRPRASPRTLAQQLSWL